MAKILQKTRKPREQKVKIRGWAATLKLHATHCYRTQRWHFSHKGKPLSPKGGLPYNLAVKWLTQYSLAHPYVGMARGREKHRRRS